MQARRHDIPTGSGAADARGDVAALLAAMDARLQSLQQELRSVAALIAEPAEPAEPAAPAAAPSQATPGAPEPAVERRVGGPGAALRRPGAQRPIEHSPAQQRVPETVVRTLVEEAEREAQRLVDDTRQRIDEIGARTRALLQQAPLAAPGVHDPQPEPGAANVMTPDWRAYEGAVTVQAGPFADVAQLKAFEDALASVPGVEDVDIRTLERDSAVFDVSVGMPTALIAELRQRAADALHVIETADSSLRCTIVRRGVDRVAS